MAAGRRPPRPPVVARVGDLAGLCAAFWRWRGRLGLAPMATRLCSFSPGTLEPELARPDVSPVVTAAFQGWACTATGSWATSAPTPRPNQRAEAAACWWNLRSIARMNDRSLISG
jgi:hypothetical protein